MIFEFKMLNSKYNKIHSQSLEKSGKNEKSQQPR
jgi:hypothetical protein